MLLSNGAQTLKDYAARTFKKEVLTISNRIHYFTGYGHSNVILIEGNQSCILIDTLDSAGIESRNFCLYHQTDKNHYLYPRSPGPPRRRTGFCRHCRRSYRLCTKASCFKAHQYHQSRLTAARQPAVWLPAQ